MVRVHEKSTQSEIKKICTFSLQSQTPKQNMQWDRFWRIWIMLDAAAEIITKHGNVQQQSGKSNIWYLEG